MDHQNIHGRIAHLQQQRLKWRMSGGQFSLLFQTAMSFIERTG
jgi:hypothetical protein